MFSSTATMLFLLFFRSLNAFQTPKRLLSSSSFARIDSSLSSLFPATGMDISSTQLFLVENVIGIPLLLTLLKEQLNSSQMSLKKEIEVRFEDSLRSKPLLPLNGTDSESKSSKEQMESVLQNISEVKEAFQKSQSNLLLLQSDVQNIFHHINLLNNSMELTREEFSAKLLSEKEERKSSFLLLSTKEANKEINLSQKKEFNDVNISEAMEPFVLQSQLKVEQLSSQLKEEMASHSANLSLEMRLFVENEVSSLHSSVAHLREGLKAIAAMSSQSNNLTNSIESLSTESYIHSSLLAEIQLELERLGALQTQMTDLRQSFRQELQDFHRQFDEVNDALAELARKATNSSSEFSLLKKEFQLEAAVRKREKEEAKRGRMQLQVGLETLRNETLAKEARFTHQLQEMKTNLLLIEEMKTKVGGLSVSLEDLQSSQRTMNDSMLDSYSSLKVDSSSKMREMKEDLETSLTQVDEQLLVFKGATTLEATQIRRAVEVLTMDVDENLEKMEQRQQSSLLEMKKMVEGVSKSLGVLRNEVKEETSLQQEALRAMAEECRQQVKDVLNRTDHLTEVVKETEDGILSSVAFDLMQLEERTMQMIAASEAASEESTSNVRVLLERELAQQGEFMTESLNAMNRAIRGELQRVRKDLLFLINAVELQLREVDDGVDGRIASAFTERSLETAIKRMAKVLARNLRDFQYRVVSNLKAAWNAFFLTKWKNGRDAWRKRMRNTSSQL